MCPVQQQAAPAGPLRRSTRRRSPLAPLPIIVKDRGSPQGSPSRSPPGSSRSTMPLTFAIEAAVMEGAVEGLFASCMDKNATIDSLRADNARLTAELKASQDQLPSFRAELFALTEGLSHEEQLTSELRTRLGQSHRETYAAQRHAAAWQEAAQGYYTQSLSYNNALSDICTTVAALRVPTVYPPAPLLHGVPVILPGAPASAPPASPTYITIE